MSFSRNTTELTPPLGEAAAACLLWVSGLVLWPWAGPFRFLSSSSVAMKCG